MTRNTRLRVILALYAVALGLAGLISAPPALPARAADEAQKLTPEQQMQKRFPHPVLVRRLIGMPVLDYDNATIGYVRQVVRSPAGKVLLIVPYSSWFGWAPTSWGKRPVAVPIEAVAILAFELAALDMMREVNFPASLSLYAMCGLVWYYRGSARQALREVSLLAGRARR